MQEYSHSKKMVIFFSIIISILLFALDNMIITPAMPRILSDIGGVSHINWVFTAYILTSTIITPIYGKLSDIFSRKKMFLYAIGFFVVSSMLCGISANIYQLIFFRGLQGIGGGAIMVASMSMIGEIFSLKERAKYQGYIGMVFALASIGGPILGAFITDMYSWRWTFYINLPLGIIAALLLYYSLPTKIHQSKNHRIDYAGSIMLVTFLVPLILLFSSVATANTFTFEAYVLAFISFIAFIFFYRIEKKAISPIFSHHLFHDRHFVIPAIMTFINAITMFAVTLYLQIYTQKVMGMSIQSSGLLLSAIMIPIVLSSPVYGQIVSRTGRYKKVVMVGAGILFVSMVSFTIMLYGTPSKNSIMLHLIPLGIGMGAMMSIFNMIIQLVYSRERMGEVTGALQLVRGVGGTFGTALLGFIFGYFVKDINIDSLHIAPAIASIFITLSILSGIAFVASLYMKEKVVAV